MYPQDLEEYEARVTESDKKLLSEKLMDRAWTVGARVKGAAGLYAFLLVHLRAIHHLGEFAAEREIYDLSTVQTTRTTQGVSTFPLKQSFFVRRSWFPTHRDARLKAET